MEKNHRADYPQVKTLNGLTIQCEYPNCGFLAGYIFRTGRGPISVLCETHAQESAARQGIELPESREKVLRAGW